VKKWLAASGVIMIALGTMGCPAVIVGSLLVGGSTGYAGYEYGKSETEIQSQPSPMPTPSLSNIE
jgi:hypothetical protein